MRFLETSTFFKLGGEFEFFAFQKQSLQPVNYDDIQKIFSSLKKRYSLIKEEGYEIGIEFGGGLKLTMEPGGQLEISTRPHSTSLKLLYELEFALQEILKASENSLVFLGHGVHPTAPKDHPIMIKKPRYLSMERYFNSVPQGRGTEMMRFTASTQVNLDLVAPIKDSIQLVLKILPLTYDLFSNSTQYHGKKIEGCERKKIWKQTDPSRTGFTKELFLSTHPEKTYREFALNAYVMLAPFEPLYGDVKFKDWTQYTGSAPTRADWQRHLTTLFPDLRLKRFAEIRTADTQDFRFSLVPFVFWETVLKKKSRRIFYHQMMDRLISLYPTWFEQDVFGENITHLLLAQILEHQEGGPFENLFRKYLERDRLTHPMDHLLEDPRELYEHLGTKLG